MHFTESPYILGYIDEQIVKKETIYVVGWAFHKTDGINEIRVIFNEDECDSLIPLRHSRMDVANHYKRNDINMSGFSFEKPIGKTATLQMKISNIDDMSEKWENVWNFKGAISVSKRIFEKNVPPTFVVVDNFYNDPNAVRDFALKTNMVAHPNAHKGNRTDQVYLFDGLKEAFEKILNVKIKDWNHYGTNGCFQYCVAGDQLVYHTDTQQYAGLIFLSPDAPPNTGTSFYRSKHTKKMHVENAAEHNIAFRHGFLDSTEFDLVDTVGNIYNRLVLFDAQLIHAASCYFGNNRNNGRLFQLFFFDIEK